MSGDAADRSAVLATAFAGCAHGLDADWRIATHAGNEALANGDVSAALDLFGSAMREAERLFESARDQMAAVALGPMLFTISCWNLAQTRKRLDEMEEAYRLKRLAVQRLVETARSHNETGALRVNCIRHLRYALTFLAEEVGGDGQRHDEVVTLLKQAHQTMRDVADELIMRPDRDRSGSPDMPVRPTLH